MQLRLVFWARPLFLSVWRCYAMAPAPRSTCPDECACLSWRSRRSLAPGPCSCWLRRQVERGARGGPRPGRPMRRHSYMPASRFPSATQITRPLSRSVTMVKNLFPPVRDTSSTPMNRTDSNEGASPPSASLVAVLLDVGLFHPSCSGAAQAEPSGAQAAAEAGPTGSREGPH